MDLINEKKLRMMNGKSRRKGCPVSINQWTKAHDDAYRSPTTKITEKIDKIGIIGKWIQVMMQKTYEAKVVRGKYN